MTKAAVASLVLLVATPGDAGQLAGVTLPDRVSVAGHELVLNGLGLREATPFIVDVYVAGLYVEAKTSDPAAILSPHAVKQLAMKFVRSVGKENLTNVFTEGFEKNVGDKRAAVAEGLAVLNAAMTDVKQDDVITLTYEPGAGVAVSVRGHETAMIPGEDFQQVLFSIWLGANPRDVSMRDGLLGRSPND